MNRAGFAALALLAVGCGGANSLVGFSPFEGSWPGTWSGTNASGPATVNIDAIGTISGTMHSNVTNADGPITGQILNNGATTITVTWTVGSPEVGDGTLVMSNAGSRLSGTVTFSGDNVSFDLNH
ncbi:MAG TPA: hypothetical protein VNI20_02010 [Fimbriimonadaceae bacterium]|nr:hypothetical protein [Fimbriimonadaceae bacterium]